jgi:hypothetical protein
VIEIIAGDDDAAAAGDSLIVRVAPYTARPAAREATIAIAIADPALAQALAAAIIAALGGALGGSVDDTLDDAPGNAPGELRPETRGTHPRAVRVRSRKGLAREASRLDGAIAVVRVTARNARHLAALVAAARAAGALGVQLVWDGADPPRAAIEHHVFAALEHARATPGEPPVVLAATAQPAAALRFLIAHRAQDRRARGGTSRAERRTRCASAS